MLSLTSLLSSATLLDHDRFEMDRRRPPPPRRPHRRRHRRQQRHRPRRRARARRAPAPASCSPCATSAEGEQAAAGDARRDARCAGSTSPTSPPCAPSPTRWEGDVDVLINNAGVMAIARAPDRRRLRAADRHEPPRALRADQPAAAAHHRPGGHRRLGRAPDGQHPPRRPQLGARRLPRAGAPTGSPSSPTCCSRSSSSGASPRPARAVRAVAAHPGYAATNLQGHTGNVLQHALMAIGNRLVAQSDEHGRAARRCTRRPRTCRARATSGPDGFQERRGHPTLVGRSAAASDRGRRRRAVGAVRGAHRRALPARRRRARLIAAAACHASPAESRA